ncbi:MAG TPA: diacylglycerol kinase family protein [Acidimicrobiales bacterium]
MRVLLIVNSSASSVTARGRVVIGKALSADHDVTVAETTRRGHATRLAQGAAADGVDVVVVLGGDGTLNEAANGLAGTDTALAPLPGGSTNVFARTLGLPDDPIEATGVLLDALAHDSMRRVGLGSVNGRYFLFHVGIGFDAAVVAEVERRGSLKRWANHVLFGWAALDTWARRYDRNRPHFAVRVPGTPTVDDALFTVCLNTDPYTFIGARPFTLAPEATLDRGLAVVTLRTLDAAPLIGVVLSALGSGTRLRRSRHVAHQVDVTEVVIDAYDPVPGPVPYQVDGDYLGDLEHLEIHHEPDILRLVIPR